MEYKLLELGVQYIPVNAVATGAAVSLHRMKVARALCILSEVIQS